jgi:dipeptidase E
LPLACSGEDLREKLLSQDVIWVGGGNTANLLAIWRLHGVDRIMREAWEAGVVLAGSSAGMICWFEDGEERRRPVYRSAVADGMPGGYAADDHAALRFEGTELVECVAGREGASAWSVALEDGEVRERALPTRLV